MMDTEERLRAWGGYYRPVRGASEERSPTGDSYLAKLGKPKKGVAKAVKRSSLSRLLLMAKGTAYRIIPDWAVDPASGKPTRSYRGSMSDDPRETLDVRRVQMLWLVLYRQQPDLAQTLRCQYQVLGKRADRREAAAAILGRDLSQRQYAYLLQRGRRWMAARL